MSGRDEPTAARSWRRRAPWWRRAPRRRGSSSAGSATRSAGVRRGLFWPLDAGRGGSNRIRGRGFRRQVDDGTDGQARHFAGIVAVAARHRRTSRRAGWPSTSRRDAPDSADGRLTEHALDFVRLVRSGELATGRHRRVGAADHLRPGQRPHQPLAEAYDAAALDVAVAGGSRGGSPTPARAPASRDRR